MSTTVTKLLQYVKELPEGALFEPKDVAACGERAAIYHALVRLKKSGELTRVARGLYARMVHSRFGRREPDPDLVVRAYAHRFNLVVARHGAVEANRLGLSTQVPMRSVWLTSGPNKVLQAGGITVELRHAPQTLLTEGRAGAILRAVAYLGTPESTQGLEHILKTLTTEERQTIVAKAQSLPSPISQSTIMALVNA